MGVDKSQEKRGICLDRAKISSQVTHFEERHCVGDKGFKEYVLRIMLYLHCNTTVSL